LSEKIKSIGIIGGGQLGLMMMDAAHKLGLKVNILDPGADCPAASVADYFICADYDDENAVQSLCKLSDAVTYEFENVPYQIIEKFSKQYNIPQGAKPLYISQHRLREKNSANKAGLNVGKYMPVNTQKMLENAIADIGYPCVLKTCQFGYDGKGQVVLKSKTDLQAAQKLVKSGDCILESFIAFENEASVIMIKNKAGDEVFMPIARNIHKNNILFKSIVPSGLGEKIEANMQTQAKKLMDYLDIDGILAIEFFVCNDGVYFNEMAPRPHNSGHFSIEGCKASQFEQTIRAVANLPFGDGTLIQPTVMVNVLGQDEKEARQYKSQNAFLHMYGKTKAKHNRKMGHMTFIGEKIKDVLKIADTFLK
jgi:5-(carboxyamino)imidazole ribonucleotide synthase